MTKVKDVRTARKGAHDGAGLIHQGLTAADHMRRGKVALHAAVTLDVFRCPIRRNRIVERHAINARCLGKTDVF